jgi:hypothetical protein
MRSKVLGLHLVNIIVAMIFLLVSFIALGPLTTTAQPAPVETTPEAVSVDKPTTFRDDFSNLRLDGWQQVHEASSGPQSTWKVSGFGVLTQSGNAGSGAQARTAFQKPGTMLVGGNKSWTDYEYTARIASGDNDAFGVVFRYSNANNYYRFSMDKERGCWQLVKKEQGQYTLLAEKAQGYTLNQWYKVKVKVAGQSIKITVDGTTAFDVADGSLPAGQVGMYSWGQQQASYDDIRVVATTNSFTIAVLPDTQYYTRLYPQIFTAQTKWLADNRGPLNIASVLHEGDITDTNTTQEWEHSLQSMKMLDGKLPYVMLGGNHDQPINNFNRYYPPSKLQSIPGFSGTYAPGRSENSYSLFSASGTDWLVIALEWGPRDSVLAWARSIAARYPNRHTIVLTHAYLNYDNKLLGSQPQDQSVPNGPGQNNGVGIWNKLVSKQSNIDFVLSGHIWYGDGTGYLASRNDAGKEVHQFLADYQGRGAPTNDTVGYLGGAGYLRLMTFYPAEDKVVVKTYSPYLNSYLTDLENQFRITNVPL